MDKAIADKILDGLYTLDDDQLDMNHVAVITSRKGDVLQKGCLASWCGYFVDVPDTFDDVHRIQFYFMWQGVDYMEQMMGTDISNVINAIHDVSGSVFEPFGAHKWPVPIYDTMKQVVHKLTGYEHVPTQEGAHEVGS